MKSSTFGLGLILQQCRKTSCTFLSPILPYLKRSRTLPSLLPLNCNRVVFFPHNLFCKVRSAGVIDIFVRRAWASGVCVACLSPVSLSVFTLTPGLSSDRVLDLGKNTGCSPSIFCGNFSTEIKPSECPAKERQ